MELLIYCAHGDSKHSLTQVPRKKRLLVELLRRKTTIRLKIKQWSWFIRKYHLVTNYQRITIFKKG